MGEPEKSDDPAIKDSTKSKAIVATVIGVLFFVALIIHFYAQHVHDRGMIQLALIAEIFLIITSIIAFAIFSSPRKTRVEGETMESESAKLAELQKKNRDEWLLRLVFVTALGMCVIVLYAVQWVDQGAISIIGLALLSAGAAWLIAVVVGFIFGIPRRSSNQPGGRQYLPSTSLEQVADWLTKIIVGVGLTQLDKIPGKLGSLASFIAMGMGDAASHKAVALAICIYFPSCGFLFGFLWARLYMLEAFDVAESVIQRVIKEISTRIGSEADPKK
jgi:hypothetical protein